MANEKLRPCPFCGGEVSLVLCDDEGNLHDESYKAHPYSGLGFMLCHTHEENPDCPIAKMNVMAGFWAVCIFTTRKKPRKRGIGGLTMAKYISAEIAKKALAESDLIPRYAESCKPITDRIIDSLPAANVAPVVRCRECIHYNESKRLCCMTRWFHDEDGFCTVKK